MPTIHRLRHLDNQKLKVFQSIKFSWELSGFAWVSMKKDVVVRAHPLWYNRNRAVTVVTLIYFLYDTLLVISGINKINKHNTSSLKSNEINDKHMLLSLNNLHQSGDRFIFCWRVLIQTREPTCYM